MAAHLVMQQAVTMEAIQEGQVVYMAAEAARPVVAAAKEVRQAAHLAYRSVLVAPPLAHMEVLQVVQAAWADQLVGQAEELEAMASAVVTLEALAWPVALGLAGTVGVGAQPVEAAE